jgi:Leucine-rich repeat (LRR) protein
MGIIIIELRFVADVLGNLTALKVLDLSYNELSQLPTAVFGPPRNLTALYLQHNQLTVLPLVDLVSLKPQLRIVNVQANRLQHFHHELMSLVENGTRILYSGKCQEI